MYVYCALAKGVFVSFRFPGLNMDNKLRCCISTGIYSISRESIYLHNGGNYPHMLTSEY